MLSLSQQILKRSFDFCLAFFCFVIFFEVIIILVTIASFSTKSFGLYRQKRIGKSAKPFYLFKIKTMYDKPSDNYITIKNDHRITVFGRFLRRTKLDELPQLINILLGQMSFVGPRPDVSGYADKLIGSDKIILSVKPGITGPASLYFIDEEYILSKQKDAKNYNDTVIWPKKVELNKLYIESWTFKDDIRILSQTLLKMFK